MKEAICPNCETLFDASKHRAYKGILADFREYTRIGHKAPETWIDENSMVLCPNCGVRDNVAGVGGHKVIKANESQDPTGGRQVLLEPGRF